MPVLLSPVFGPIIGGLIVDEAARRNWHVHGRPARSPAWQCGAVDHRAPQRNAGVATPTTSPWTASRCSVLAWWALSSAYPRTEGGGVVGPEAYGPIAAGLLLVALFALHSVRVARPLIDVRLFRSMGFRAASIATLLLAAALFGSLLALPLYYQVDRGLSALAAGLLLAPQGVGAAVMLPLAGRLTDRIGGGRLVVAGSTVVALATVPVVFLTAHTSYVLLGGVLFLRGLGLGASIKPTTAAAYAILGPPQVPHAIAALNTLRQIGASVGTALIAVVLQHESTAALASATSAADGMFARVPPGEQKRIAGPLAGAFGHTFA